MKAENQVVVVLCTFPDHDQARQIGTALVERQLVACVNLVPGVESIYRWEGRICREGEVLGVMKTVAGRFGELREAIEAMHSHETPELLALPVEEGSEGYLKWVIGAVKN